ncbi:MAG: [protein-PII] uridylyltransferase [Candidatus Hydrogenedentes bacterium]|nr:[protein-PII] uridylyltransferase [Candidatus Hydrogenedentota bacterium]
MTVAAADFDTLRGLARTEPRQFREVPHAVCLQAIRMHVLESRRAIRNRHAAGESGANTLHQLTVLCDDVVRAALEFGLAWSRNSGVVLNRVALCALGGYGRGEMSPFSDLDVSLLFDSELDGEIERLASFLHPLFWDIGFSAGFALHSVGEAAALAATDPQVCTTYLQARLVGGDATTLGRLKLLLADLPSRTKEGILAHIRRRERLESLPAEQRDLYAPEPDIKENAGGLRDFHAALWMVMLGRGVFSLDDMEREGLITPMEHLDLMESLDFLWRTRNEMHFHAGRCDNRLAFPMQAHIASVFGYGTGSAGAVGRLMEDYYQSAARVREFMHAAARVCDQAGIASLFADRAQNRARMTLHNGQLCADPSDKNWFAENPARLMEVFWECARRVAPLSPGTAHWVSLNARLAGQEFRESNVVRRFFLAVCGRFSGAGTALREAARTGVLGAYLPEFAAVRGLVRYEDFHSSPVDEHTLRAVEALAEIPAMKGPVGRFLNEVLERIGEPHLLVLSILLHDLGKAAGEIHVAEGVRVARAVCDRLALPEHDALRVLFLVEHHMTMSDIAFYRDTEDLDVVQGFAGLVRSPDTLAMLLLVTYADLCAVAPNVWNEWKGSLLMKLHFQTERLLTGRETPGEQDLRGAKAALIADGLPDRPRDAVLAHLAGMGDRYVFTFSPAQVAAHLACLEDAARSGLGVRCLGSGDAGPSEVIVCTRDRRGLFADIAGVMASRLISIQNAALFTRNDGWVVDCFLVEDSVSRRPLTENEFAELEGLLRDVLGGGEEAEPLVERARTRLFALRTSVVPVRTVVEIDNRASRTDTVVDVVTGDRTGLLHDIARTLARTGVDVTAAHIMTEVGRVRDSFYVRKDGRKIEDKRALESVRTSLREAIFGHPGT